MQSLTFIRFIVSEKITTLKFLPHTNNQLAGLTLIITLSHFSRVKNAVTSTVQRLPVNQFTASMVGVQWFLQNVSLYWVFKVWCLRKTSALIPPPHPTPPTLPQCLKIDYKRITMKQALYRGYYLLFWCEKKWWKLESSLVNVGAYTAVFPFPKEGRPFHSA